MNKKVGVLQKFSAHLGEHPLGKYMIMPLPNPLAHHRSNQHTVEDANDGEQPQHHQAHNEHHRQACLTRRSYGAAAFACCSCTAFAACGAVCPHAQSPRQVTVAQPGRRKRNKIEEDMTECCVLHNRVQNIKNIQCKIMTSASFDSKIMGDLPDCR